MKAADLLEVEPAAFLASQARGCLDKMWEGILQGVYWDAYAELTPAEKFDLLSLALSEGDGDGMFLSWRLRELIKIGDPRAVATRVTPIWQLTRASGPAKVIERSPAQRAKHPSRSFLDRRSGC